ncbi:MAG: hypothetical protein DRJ51_03165 [Thermoprotei archaeon]|nr:MAG: hypothetical protein DRJ51_03165 [Thermoprotei archaeon]RLF02724.1 MAG: hypothetical protein DRJ59_02775 [Thermoprotei archaeon]
MRKILLLLVLVLVLTTISYVRAEPRKILVVATIPPLAAIAEEVGGERVEVAYLVPGTSDPHQYAPTLRDINLVMACDLFIEVGKEPFLNSLPEKRGKVKLSWNNWTNAGLLIRDGNPHYIWLYLENVKKVARLVAKALAKLDPEHSEFYLARANKFAAKIENLEKWIRAYVRAHGVGEETVALIGSHFIPLVESIGLKFMGPLLESEGQTPTPKDLNEFIRRIEESGTKLIVVLATQRDADEGRIARSIASEKGISIVYLHGIQFHGSDDYFEYIKYTVASLVAGIESARSGTSEEKSEWSTTTIILATIALLEAILLLKWRVLK